MSLQLAPDASSCRSASSGEAAVLVSFDETNGAAAHGTTQINSTLHIAALMSARTLNLLVQPAFSRLTGVCSVVCSI